MHPKHKDNTSDLIQKASLSQQCEDHYVLDPIVGPPSPLTATKNTKTETVDETVQFPAFGLAYLCKQQMSVDTCSLQHAPHCQKL